MRMKILRISNFGLVLLLTLLVSIQAVQSLGVTRPIPMDLKLLRGDSARFYFQIQAVMEGNKQSCSYSVSGIEPLVVTFDEKNAVVKAGEIQNIYGTISVPNNAPIKTYNGDLTVSCAPSIEGEVSGSVIHKTMIVPFTASVVETVGERSIRQIQEEEKPAIPSLTIYTIIILIILIVSIGVSYLFGKKNKEK
jgi:hypothetical protein